MALTPGTRLGAYEVTAQIGEGGMGEVYKGRDTRLDRTVAIKVLPESLSSDPRFRERFDREARTISRLTHPNICTLYDVGEQTGTAFLVMELLEGETLEARCTRASARGSGLPLNEALRIAIQVADALGAAHRLGIVHRDLKPGNIFLVRTSGASAPPIAKLLDFGLARTAPALTVNSVTRMSTTPPQAITAQGTIVGTFQYMAPEQVEGGEADARTDIFAFGSVLYEMLTGKKAFEGKSHVSLLTAILEHDPQPMSAAQTMTPPMLEHLVTRCLAKDPDERWQSATDVAHELRWIVNAAPSAATRQSTESLRKPWVWIAGTVVCFLGAVTMAVVHLREAPPPARVLRYTIPLPKDGQGEGIYFQFHVSPDGRFVAASGVVGDLTRGIFVRELDSWTWRLLRGTTTGDFFWSPDSRDIGFFDTGKLKKVRVSGGPPEDVSDVPGEIYGIEGAGSWGKGNVIAFTPLQAGGPLLQVSAAGGTPRPLTHPADGASHTYPTFLPDGRHFLYTSRGGSSPGVYVASLGDPAGRRLLADESSAHFAPAGDSDGHAHLLFVRNGKVMAQRFDANALALEGDAFVVAERASFGDNGAATVSASDNGVLVLPPSSNRESDSRLAWFDRSGKMLATEGPLGSPSPTSVSPDGRTVAVLRRPPGSLGGEIWLRGPSRDVGETRFTFENAIAYNANMVWSPDGGRIAFSSPGSGTVDLYIKDLRASAPRGEPIFRNGHRKFVTDWSRDLLVYTEIDPKTGADLWYLRVAGSRTANAAPVKFLQTEFDESFGQISPDGRWIAYLSNESGTYEVYVRPFPSGAGKWRISAPFGTAQASEPRWSRDGRELFYLTGPAGKYTLMAVAVKVARPAESGATPVFDTAGSTPLFEVRVNSFHPGTGTYFYTVSNDSQRFLINHIDAASEPVLNVIVNWQQAFR